MVVVVVRGVATWCERLSQFVRERLTSPPAGSIVQASRSSKATERSPQPLAQSSMATDDAVTSVEAQNEQWPFHSALLTAHDAPRIQTWPITMCSYGVLQAILNRLNLAEAHH